MKRGVSAFNIVAVALGLAFLYLPIVILVIFSFNASRLVTIWGGWSLEWYRELLATMRCFRRRGSACASRPFRPPAPPFSEHLPLLRSPAGADSVAGCCSQA